ncbi:MAG: glutathione S-transferase N-terminal domain-containing protein [Patescibacteria group bacterium]|nr:glutathione S-transferase N-terminal domain-containing protein [Patescibacteria group bacterium]MCL5261888.1 glutathione S-transferase N-terminal domain-containing protein [Patescibacteria group bacterium]
MKIKIYSTPACIYCRMAKEFFTKNNIKFEEVDVAADRRAAEEMVAKSHQMGVPVIDIDGEIFIGFNRRDLAEKLGIK